jgi:hypothetical protein
MTSRNFFVATKKGDRRTAKVCVVALLARKKLTKGRKGKETRFLWLPVYKNKQESQISIYHAV